jgi:hypothetical protein
MADEARSRLGRGLASLIGDVGGEAAHVDRPRAQRSSTTKGRIDRPRTTTTGNSANGRSRPMPGCVRDSSWVIQWPPAY